MKIFRSITKSNLKNPLLPNLILVCLPFLILASQANAKTTNKTPDNYQIELIIFKYNSLSEMHSEHWPLHEISKPENAKNLVKAEDAAIQDISNNDLTNKDYVLLDNNKLKYKDIYNRIKSNSRYTVLSHIGWQESRQDLIQAKSVYINTGRIFQLSKGANKILESTNSEAGAIDQTNISSDNDINLNIPEISGVVKIALKKFFHADIKLLLSAPAKTTSSLTHQTKPFELINTNKDSIDIDEDFYMQTFLIEDNTRLKSKQLGYVDHPVFGAVIVIS